MIANLIRWSIYNRLLVLMATLLLSAWGIYALQRTPLDAIGHPRSEGTKVTEKYRRPDYGHLQTELTFDDTTLYTKPFTVKINYEIVTDNDIFEMFCGQNEKDRQHMVTGPTSMEIGRAHV